jgi:hypothetical protein
MNAQQRSLRDRVIINMRTRSRLTIQNVAKAIGCSAGTVTNVLRRHNIKDFRVRPDIETRFWQFVDVKGENDCWMWQGSHNGNGYGELSQYALTGNVKPKRAHRLSWEIHNGKIPDGMCVCHHCDTPRCVNPNHLFLGTHADNMHDASVKGRAGRKPKNKTSAI